MHGKRQHRPESTAAILSPEEIKTTAVRPIWWLFPGFPKPYGYGLGFVLLKIKSL